jgi:hypothetical protein
LVNSHRSSAALASLAVKAGGADRALFFDQAGKLAGWYGEEGVQMIPGSCAKTRAMEFIGIQMVSRKIFEYLRLEQGKFSIIRAYINAAERGEIISGFEKWNAYWMDAGTPKALERLRSYLKAITA